MQVQKTLQLSLNKSYLLYNFLGKIKFEGVVNLPKKGLQTKKANKCFEWENSTLKAMFCSHLFCNKIQKMQLDVDIEPTLRFPGVISI